MDLFQAFVLGTVQGVTEYLPVSSSAHLVLVPEVFGWHFPQKEAFIFDVLVQLGTLVGVVAYFYRDLLKIIHSVWTGLWTGRPLETYEARVGWLVVLATVPASAIGVIFKEEVEVYFASPKAVMFFLLATSVFLIAAEFFGKKNRQQVKSKDAVVMGVSQVMALLPGISRSGVTIAGGVYAGLSRQSAAKFSFLMSIPVLLGASLVAGKDMVQDVEKLSALALPLLVGCFSAAVSGYFVIRWFLNFLKTQSLLWFALYCALVGGGGLFLYG